EDVFASCAFRPDQIVDALHALQIHREAFKAIRDFAGCRVAVQTAYLLKISELGDFHTVEPYFPAEPPCAQGRVLPVVFYETDVVFFGVDTQCHEGADIKIDDFRRRGLEHYLILVVMLKPVRVLTIAPILGATGRLHISRAPGLRADGTQESRRIRGACADFHIVWL